MMNPKVSVIVTIYNREKYLNDCVCSLFEQTLDEIEYVFIDDASTDRSVEILYTLLSKYPNRAKWCKIICLNENKGVSNARNVGLNHVTGDYVIHADSDDWVDNSMYEVLYKTATETGASIVGCNICHEYGSSHSVFYQHYSNTIEDNIRNLINGDIHPSLCTSLVRRSIITSNHISFLVGLNMGEDLFFNLQLYLLSDKIVGIDNSPYHYRHSVDSSSHHHTDETINSTIEIGRKIEKLMKMKGLYSQYSLEIEFRKFLLKYSLIYEFHSRSDYKQWVKIFPETHRYIFQFDKLDYKLRIEMWLAAHHMFYIAKMVHYSLKLQSTIRGFLYKWWGKAYKRQINKCFLWIFL